MIRLYAAVLPELFSVPLVAQSPAGFCFRSGCGMFGIDGDECGKNSERESSKEAPDQHPALGDAPLSNTTRDHRRDGSPGPFQPSLQEDSRKLGSGRPLDRATASFRGGSNRSG